VDRPIAWSAVADWADARETGERRALFDWQVWITWRDGTSQRQERVRPMNEGEARCNLTRPQTVHARWCAVSQKVTVDRM